MTAYEQIRRELEQAPRTWLITGVAGFIGSNLLESLLRLNQRVVGLDNFSTGYRRNLKEVESRTSRQQWRKFRLLEGDIDDLKLCRKACAGVDYVMHEAALGSVPASIEDPLACHRANVSGFLNVLVGARDANLKRLVYASSSAVYGDNPDLPKSEDKVGRVLSPYAASKAMGEIYAAVFNRSYGLESIGLRYFNVFGARQDPQGAYAAVIPKWLAALLERQTVYVNGDGETTRDFCYIENVVQANLLAATTHRTGAVNQVYNIAYGARTTLNELFQLLQRLLRKVDPALPERKPTYRDFRPGDVRHSVADIRKAGELLGYYPTHGLEGGLDLALDWYRRNAGAKSQMRVRATKRS
jgi:UDP-N-acetylglucosamine 4-epimerase